MLFSVLDVVDVCLRCLCVVGVCCDVNVMIVCDVCDGFYVMVCRMINVCDVMGCGCEVVYGVCCVVLCG